MKLYEGYWMRKKVNGKDMNTEKLKVLEEDEGNKKN